MSDKPSIFQAFLDFARTPVGMIMLLTLWPSLLGLLGLPTGAAELALQMYRGQPEAAPCVPSAPSTDASAPASASAEAAPAPAAVSAEAAPVQATESTPVAVEAAAP